MKEIIGSRVDRLRDNLKTDLEEIWCENVD
jgi:hypothetical protein